MTTTELITKLQQLEAVHGSLAVYLEAKATGVNMMDEGGNIIENYTISPLVEKCEVNGTEDGTKVVWLMGSVAADEPEPDDEDEDNFTG
jgi:hypothetical protein